jgi:hypothetical protein
MPSLDQLPSIIDVVASWISITCGNCGAFVDVLRPLGLTLTHDPGRLTLRDPAGDVCPECRIAAQPEAERPRRVRDYALHRAARAELGLSAQPITLYVADAEPPESAGRWTGYRMVLYLLQGNGLQDLREVTLSDWPPFHAFASPDVPGVALVYVGAAIGHERIPGAYLKFRWDVTRPADPFRLEFHDWHRLSPAEWNLLAAGRVLLAEQLQIQTGRPVGSTLRDCEWYWDRAEAYLREHRKVPTEREFQDFAEVSRTTMRENLEACGLWPWNVFSREAFPLASIRR